MTDYPKALAALREALDLQAKVGKADTIARFAGHARVTKRARDLLAALDAPADEVTDEYARAFHDGWLACERGDAEPPVPAQQPAVAVPATAAECDFIGSFFDLFEDSEPNALIAKRALVKIKAALAQHPAAAVPDGYAGCTLWRDGLRVTVIDDEVIEQRADADEAFCELAQRALDSFAAAWDSRNAAMLAAARKGE